jgi:hypothetical protein
MVLLQIALALTSIVAEVYERRDISSSFEQDDSSTKDLAGFVVLQ